MESARYAPLLCLIIAASAAAQEPPVAQDLPLIQRADEVRVFGSDSARYAIDEFVDFACTTCRAFYQTRGDSLADFVAANDLQLTIRIYPIPRLMRGFQAAEAALCAGAFGGPEAFLGMMDQLFRFHDLWRHELDPGPILDRFAENVEVPMPSFRACLARDAMAPLIINDVRTGMQAEITGTPSFLFNVAGSFSGDVKFYGNQPLEEFERALAEVMSGDVGGQRD